MKKICEKYLLVILTSLIGCIGNAQVSPLEKGLEGRLTETDRISRSYVTPLRLIPLADSLSTGVSNPQALLHSFDGQLSTGTSDLCQLSTVGGKSAAVLIDFGKELYGSIEFAAPIRQDQRALKIRVCFGESVSEAMSDVDAQGATATNQHSLRDFTVGLPWLGTVEVGNSGFRFVRIELVEPETVLPVKSVRAVLKYRDLPYLGSFRCSDERLTRIWETGAYTVHLNMQDYLWDGVKRDRLVWVGDMHPEVMTIASVFGNFEVVHRSLDFVRDSSPLPNWMNGIAAYSMWWLIIHHDLYMYGGDLPYLREQKEYINGLIDVLSSNMDGNRENLQGGQRLLDWPTSEMPEVIHSGYQSLMVMTMEAGARIGEWTGDKDMRKKCIDTLDKLRKYNPGSCNNKQAAAMLLISGMAESPTNECDIIAKDGANGFSTFFGYYMLRALAMGGRFEEAMEIISDYWGAMLDLGATSFWEDLDYAEALKAARIDEPVPHGAFDYHASSGNYCYKGHRHSFCHGWASGPTSWMSQYILGITPLEPGCRKVAIRPNLGKLQWAEGSFPTPYGVINVKHRRQPSGKIETTYTAPDGVKVIL